MEVGQQRVVFTEFVNPFLSRDDLPDPACLANTTSSADWLEKNFGNFSVYATLEDLQRLNENFSSFASLALLSPSQVAELTLSSGALNNTNQIVAVFDRLENGNAFKNVEEFLTTLTASPEIPDIAPAVRDVMMNRTFVIIELKFPEFVAHDWEVWFTEKLIPVLPSFTAEMLLKVTAGINCTNYHVIVEGMGDVFYKMTFTRRQEITRVLVEHLKQFAVRFNSPALSWQLWNPCHLTRKQSSCWIRPPVALENVTVVKEVLSSILRAPDEKQLEKFFETFVEVSKEENIAYITNADVRDAILNLTLTALAPKFPLFQTSDYELWFQINLVVLLASFRPSVLVVIPANLTCDSYDAILKGLDNALVVLPSAVGAELKSSIDELRQSPPEGCTPPRPVGFCKETIVDEVKLCSGVNSGRPGSQPPSSDQLCNFTISNYACSSDASSLSSDALVTLLTCKVPSMNSSAETWKLFFQKVAGVLEVALSAYSNNNLSGHQAESSILDAIGEVKVNNFSAAQLTDVSFISDWFQGRLRPFLPAVSRDFLSCLSSKNFSCDTYQVVVQALSRQASLMEVGQQRVVFTEFVNPFLSRDDLPDPACLANTTSSADWLEKNFGNFSVYATLEDLQRLNENFSSFASLALLSPSQVAELTLSSGALNNTNQIVAVFDRLENGNAFKNVEEFLTTLTASPEIPDIAPAVRDVMMNRTFVIIELKFPEFVAHDWEVWFTEKLIPVLPSFTAEMLLKVTAGINCTNYHVIVEGMGDVFYKMTFTRRQEITRVLVEHLKQFAVRFNSPDCRKDIGNDAEWLDINLGLFSTVANYTDLKELNISGLAALESLSPDQKAELLLDPSTGALENVTVVKEVLSSILRAPDEKQLEKFFETFVEVSKEENIAYITNADVRDAILNLTLTALAPKFPLFQTSDYELWFQINLVVLLASFRPSVLVVIPANLTCDSYDAILKGLDNALVVLPSAVGAELKSSIDELRQSPPEGCTPPRPVGFCKETIVDEVKLCSGVNSGRPGSQPPSSDQLCNFTISNYACSSDASSLSSDALVTLLTCKVPSSMNSSAETWKLFFQKVAGVLEVALSAYSNNNLSGHQAESSILDAIGEVKVNNFSAAQLTDVSFISDWFQGRLRPFLPAVSRDFLSCLSSKNFSCDTYQVVVQALSRQASLMEVGQQRVVFTEFVNPFLSRDDLPDPACLANTTSSADWLEKNFGNFSVYATLEDLQRLNENFSSFASLALLSPSQVAELTLSSGALNNTNQIVAVFDRLENGNAFKNVEEFLTTLTASPEIPDIAPAVRDVMMNRTFVIIELKFPEFVAHDWEVWFTEKLIPVLPSFTAEMLLKVTAGINCTNYHVIVEGMGDVFYKMTFTRRQEITRVLVEHLKQFAVRFNSPDCRKDIGNDAEWLDINLGLFSTVANYTDLKELNISGLAALESLSPDQKAELLLDPSTGALENVTVVKEVLSSILRAPDEKQLEKFFETFVEVSKEENIAYITNADVRDAILNLTLTALAPKFPLFQTSDYELWFQINLVVLLASFRPSVLVVIPANLTCDSYDAILKGLDNALVVLPSAVGAELKSSIDELRQSPPEGCTPPRPVGFCKETIVDEVKLCSGVNSGRPGSQPPSSDQLCNFTISNYACSSDASSLSSDALVTLLTCKVPSSMNSSAETWKLFFQKVAGVLEVALSAYSNNNLSGHQAESSILDAIGEVKVNNFSAAQLTDVSFISDWFQGRLRPFLPAVSRDFLSCLSSKNFSCDTYQVVVQALSRQASLMEVGQQRVVFTEFVNPFLSRDDLPDPACLANTTSSADWLEKNFGNFSVYATLEDLQRLNENFSSFASLALLSPSQVAELTLSSGALNNTNQIVAVFDRLENGNAFKNVEEFLTTLTASPEIPDIAPAVRDVMMNRTFVIIELKFPEFVAHDWEVWFTEKLIPVLPSFTAEMLLKVTAGINCTNYHVIVEGMGDVFYKMTFTRRQEITRVLVEHLKQFAVRFNSPDCRKDIGNDAEWLDINLGLFSTVANYTDLKELNISGLAALESLSPDQKAELLLDPSTGALENVTVVKEVLSSILRAPDEKQLEKFFETFVEVSKEENIAYITNADVRDAILNLTLTALAPKFPLFQTSDYELWFQINLVVLLASFRPSVLVVIPANLTCDSYDAILKGLDNALVVLPSAVGAELKSSIDELRQSPPEGCTPPRPVGFCKETIVDEVKLCSGVNSGRPGSQPPSSDQLCNFTIPNYACSSDASSLSSDALVTLLTCKVPSSMNSSAETWKLFFQKVAGVLEVALSAYSNNNLSGHQAESSILDAIGEVKVNNFSAAQLTDVSFISDWFQGRLRPFLPAVSRDFLSCLSSKNFSCDTYQVVVQALSRQASLMEVGQQRVVFTEFVNPFLSRDDLPDPACLANTTSSADWLEKNFGNFSVYATLEDLQRLNENFSSFASLALLSPSQVAELTLSSGALNNTNQIVAVFDRLENGNAFKNVEEFLTTLTASPEIPDIAPAVRDVMMNRTFVIIELKFPEFVAHDWEVWFTEKLIPVLPSFTAEMLLKVTAGINCTNYHVIVEGMGDVFYKMTFTRRQEITRVLVEHLKQFAVRFNSPDCRKDIGNDAEWLDINLGLFSTVANYTDLKELNISGLAALESLSPDQKAELLLDPSTGALENVTVVKEVLSSILRAPDEKQLEKFFETFVEVSKEENIAYITNADVRDAILNLTLTALAPKFPLFQTSDYELWFQINLVVLLASFRPSVLVVIPANLTCDSYDAILKGLDNALVVLPSAVGAELKSSIDELRQSPPEGCTPPRPVGFCKETIVDEVKLCSGVNSGRPGSQPPSSDQLCNFTIPNYACSSDASSLSSDALVTLLTCKVPSSMNSSAETWKLFFQKVAGVLEVALSAYSNNNLSGHQAESSILDAIGEVKVNNFSAAQLTDVSFISDWFQGRLRPFLPAVSRDFLSCLSSKNFSCDTYQVVVQALSRQASLMEVGQQRVVFTEFVNPFLSRDDLPDPACLANTTSSADWLEKNFGNFSVYATLEDLQRLNENFSSFASLALLSPSQVAELTLSSGALNNTNQIVAVFDRLENGNAFKNVEEFLTTLTASPEIPDIAPAVRDVMMNRTFVIIELKFPEFVAHDWEVWFTEKLIPVLPSFTAEMLLKVTAGINCTNYHVIVEGMGDVFYKMTFTRRQEITRVLVEHLKQFAVRFNSPDCRKDIGNDAEWLDINLGLFSTVANYTDLKELNISGLAALESLSPDQKAELLLDPSTGALENVTVVKEVLSSILRAPDEKQLEKFFETFVEVSKEENIAYITNADVRDAILNLTLTALAPKFPLFQTSDYELWFQINLVVLLASFRPSVLVVIPANLTCDSYDAILKGLDNALVVLPSAVGAELKSSIDELRQSPPEGCTPPRPVGFCKETIVDEVKLCSGVNSGRPGSQPPSSDQLCNFTIPNYACSSDASSLSSDALVTLLTCKVPSSMNSSAETWKLFFQKVAGVLEVALSAYSNNNLSGHQAESSILDAIGEVKVNNFSAAQLTDVSFISDWFQGRLRPFLPAVSRDFLSCLSSKNFSCDTYQVVVQALSRQASLMEVGQQRVVFTEFVNPFLSRDDLPDPACLANTTSSADWLEKNFGNFSVYATLEDLQRLNENFSSFASLALLSPSQVAELTLSSGALNNTNQIVAVFDRLENGNAFKNVEEFLTTLTASPEIPDIAPAVRDVMMNRTFVIIELKFPEFVAHDWEVWFTEKLIPVLPSFTAEMLLKVTAGINCTNYHVIVEGMGDVFYKMTFTRRQEITRVLVEHLKQFAVRFNSPDCRRDIGNDAEWLDINLGLFSTVANYTDLKELNISGLAALESLSPDQKAELLLDPSTGALENVTVVKRC
ncbi:uncharacterized protein LOC113100655 [Carassius auratus]|uniref:Uncharacterized protein LOC113100655 n=1 Tax=Carassius auratus TaxID=7957 RepID=A0A6P6PJX2_CARAU|nr:uncharacterized protein LOC113100655 [Carassius auratus]